MVVMTSLDGINGRSIQTLLRREKVLKQSDEMQVKMSFLLDLIMCLADFTWVNGSTIRLFLSSRTNFYAHSFVFAY